MRKFLFLFLLVFLLVPLDAKPEIYKYVDKNGNIAFTDNLNNVPENQRPKTEGMQKKQASPHYPPEASPNPLQGENKGNNPSMMEILKKEFGAKEVCPEETKEDAEQAIKESWANMTGAMITGDLETAFSHYSLAKRDEHRRRLSEIGKEKLKAIFGSYDSIVIGKFKGRRVECGAIRYEGGKRYAYTVYYVRDMDCVWRIDSF